MNATHTPGPWCANGNQIEAETRLHTIVATTVSGGVQYAAKSQDEARANAHLMAAAPDLMAALKDCAQMLMTVSVFQSDPEVRKEMREQRNIALAALSKAQVQS